MNMQGVNNLINPISQSIPQEIDNNSKSGHKNSIHEKNIAIEKNAPIDPKETENKDRIDEKKVLDAIEKANKKIQGNDKEFQYSVHEQTKQIMVKVIDKQSGELINEFPPEKILDMVAKMWETAGLLVDERR